MVLPEAATVLLSDRSKSSSHRIDCYNTMQMYIALLFLFLARYIMLPTCYFQIYIKFRGFPNLLKFENVAVVCLSCEFRLPSKIYTG